MKVKNQARVFYPTKQAWKAAILNMLGRGEITVEQANHCLARLNAGDKKQIGSKLKESPAYYHDGRANNRTEFYHLTIGLRFPPFSYGGSAVLKTGF